MTGGLLQLVASGNQDLMLTYKPEFTFFKKIYHRHTNFSKFMKEIQFKNKPSFGKENNIIIPRNGDLLDNMYIKIKIPSIQCDYTRSKYEEYKKRLNDLSLELIREYDFILTEKNLINIDNIINTKKIYYIALTDDTPNEKVILQYDSNFYYINEVITESYTYYIRLSELYKVILNNAIESDDKIFSDFGSSTNYDKDLSISKLDISSSKIIYELYGNYSYCSNYHSLFTYLLHENINTSSTKLKSPNIYLNDLYIFYKNVITLNLNVKTINLLDYKSFSRGTSVDITLNKQVLSDIYIIKISKLNILEDNLKIVFNLSEDEFSNKIIKNILKQIKVKSTTTQDIVYNYNYYYQELTSTLRTDLTSLSTLPAKTGFSGNDYTVTDSTITGNNITLTLDTIDNLETEFIIFGFINTNTTKVIPDSFYVISSIDDINKQITCTIPELELFDSTTTKLSDGQNLLNVPLLQNIYSDIYNNYLYIENLISNLLSSYSDTDYNTYIKDINREVIQNELQIIKNIINSYFNKTNNLSRYYNINQNTLVVDGSSLKSIIDYDIFTLFKNQFIENTSEELYTNDDLIKFNLYNRLNDIFNDFFFKEPKLWDTYVTGSFKDKDYNILKTRLSQVNYLTINKPSISVVYSTVKLSDGSTTSAVGDIYEIYPDNGSGSPDTSGSPLCELVTASKTTITSPITMTTLILQFNGEIDLTSILIGNHLVKKNTVLFARITDIYNSYNEITNVSLTPSQYRGFFYTNVFYNFYNIKVFQELSSSTIPVITVVFSGAFLIKFSDSSTTTTIPSVGESYFLYSNVTQTILTKLDILSVTYDSVNTTLELRIEPSSRHDFQILTNFWLLDVEDTTTSIGAKLTSVDTTKLINLNSKIAYISAKIYEIISQTEFNTSLSTLTKEATLSYFAKYSQLFNTTSIINELFNNYTDFVTIGELKDYLENKVIEDITYTYSPVNNISTLTDIEVIDISKKYLLTTFLDQSSEYEFSIIRGMDNHISNYLNIIDDILKDEEQIGYTFYNYVNDTDVFNKTIIKDKIENQVLKKSETHALSVVELALYTDVVTTLETNFVNNLTLYDDNKTLLEISKFDIDSNIFADPNQVKIDIVALITSNNLITGTVDTTIYNDGLDDTFSTENINNSLYIILDSIKTTNKYTKFMYLENLLTALLQNKIHLKKLIDIKKINKFIVNETSLEIANEYLIENNHESYTYFTENSSNIYIPLKDESDITKKFNYIYNLSAGEKIIENDIYNLEVTVREQILTYYTTGITNDFLTVESLEDYLTSNIGGTYKFKYGTILTNTEFTNQDYIDVLYYIDEVDEYGAIISLYLLNLTGTIVNSLEFPFNLRNLWLSDEISQITTTFSTSGFIITIKTDTLPHPSIPGTFPNSTNSYKILPQDFSRNIRLRVGENDDDPTDVTVNDIGILANGVILFTVFGITGIPNSEGTGIDEAPVSFHWNPVAFLERYGSDTLGGSPDSNNLYHYYESSFLTNWSYVGLNSLYYYSTNYNGDILRHSNGHSKILGIMMDGYPLYGPYGYTTPLDDTSDIVRITTSYQIKASLDPGRPTETENPIGDFIEDYEYSSGLGHLDEYNGRNCVTPEYPNQTYAYFITIDANGKPEFPYILGSQFKNVPSTSSTYNPTDPGGTNTNVLPDTTTSIQGFSDNESVFLSGGSGYQGEATITSENNIVKIDIIQSGYQYKKGDVVLLRKQNIDSTLEYYDEKKFLLKRKSRFTDGFYYDYSNNKLKLTSILETDLTRMEEFLLELKSLIVSGTINTSTIDTSISVDIFNLIPIHLIILQLMTINNTTNNFIEDIKKVDMNQDINNLLHDQFYLDVFNIYIDKYKNDKFIYYYNKNISYTKYEDSEYKLLSIDLGEYIRMLTTDDIIQIKRSTAEKVKKLQDNNKKLEDNLIILNNILVRPDKPIYSWISKLGNFIFERINIYFNELLIDTHYSDWINIWYELNNIKNKSKGQNRLIGNLKDLSTLNNSIKPEKILYIPLRFWFCNIQGFNIPLIAMPYVDIKLNVKLEELDNLIRKNIGVNIIGKTELSATLLINYIYLDQNERKLFAESRHEYLIEQTQFNGFNNIYNNKLNMDILLSFKNSIKDIFYILVKKNDIYTRDRCNYSISDTDYINGENPVESTTFEFNGRQRFKNYDGEYTNYIIPYERYLSTPSDGINVVSFGIDNKVFQPSGTCNFSLIENPYLKLSIKSGFLGDSEGKVLVFARSYNILRIMSGLCGLAFVN